MGRATLRGSLPLFLKHLALAAMHPMNYFNLAFLLFAATGPGWPAHALPQEAAARPQGAAAPLLQTVRLIGASATDGFGNAAELQTGRNIPLATFFRACLSDANAAADLDESSTSLFFIAPKVTGAQQAAWARAADPTLVIALDFLFWYGCGVDRWRDHRRLEGLEKGLEELSAFTCSLVVGTIPDIHHALEGMGPFGQPVISVYQVPSEADRLAMNERILEWAAARDNVQVVDLASSFHSIVAGEPIEIRDQTWRINSVTDILQADFLHPNLDGYVMTVLAIADALTRFDGASEQDFVFDKADVKDRFLALIEPTRVKHAERKARRVQREIQRTGRRAEQLPVRRR